VLRHLGAHQALNMDGGSSKRLVLLGQTLDLPTTEIVNYENGGTPIRPVHTAFLVKPLREEKR
jgi:exopolysaccharide biosynthesis protein